MDAGDLPLVGGEARGALFDLAHDDAFPGTGGAARYAPGVTAEGLSPPRVFARGSVEPRADRITASKDLQ